MRAIQVRRFGPPDVLQVADLSDPVPGPDQVVVAAAASDVLFVDTMIRSGAGASYFPIKPPYVPGNGVGGTVVAVGESVGRNGSGGRVAAHTGGPAGQAGTPNSRWRTLSTRSSCPTRLTCSPRLPSCMTGRQRCGSWRPRPAARRVGAGARRGRRDGDTSRPVAERPGRERRRRGPGAGQAGSRRSCGRIAGRLRRAGLGRRRARRHRRRAAGGRSGRRGRREKVPQPSASSRTAGDSRLTGRRAVPRPASTRMRRRAGGSG